MVNIVVLKPYDGGGGGGGGGGLGKREEKGPASRSSVGSQKMGIGAREGIAKDEINVPLALSALRTRKRGCTQ